MSETRKPVLIEIDDLPKGDKPKLDPSTAPPVPDPELPRPQGAAMQTATAFAARPGSRLGRWFWGIALSLVTLMVSLAAWDYVTGLLDRNLWLGRVVLGLMIALVSVLALVALRELAALSRLSKVDHLQRQARSVITSGSLAEAVKLRKSLKSMYRGREDMRWAMDEMAGQEDTLLDADAAVDHAERSLMAPLDDLARLEIEGAARRVATATALVPLALADVFVALTSNIRMIRRIAEIYGGRAGTLGSWRLMRAVATHLVATGAVAVGDDMISSIAGGGLVSKLSRRFGEGVVNGALTARVGVAAMEVCRPLPFRALKRPGVTTLVRRALTGLFSGQG